MTNAAPPPSASSRQCQPSLNQNNSVKKKKGSKTKPKVKQKKTNPRKAGRKVPIGPAPQQQNGENPSLLLPVPSEVAI